MSPRVIYKPTYSLDLIFPNDDPGPLPLSPSLTSPHLPSPPLPCPRVNGVTTPEEGSRGPHFLTEPERSEWTLRSRTGRNESSLVDGSLCLRKVDFPLSPLGFRRRKLFPSYTGRVSLLFSSHPFCRRSVWTPLGVSDVSPTPARHEGEVKEEGVGVVSG